MTMKIGKAVGKEEANSLLMKMCSVAIAMEISIEIPKILKSRKNVGVC